MNKNVDKHNLVSIETGDRKETNKLVHTKRGWVKLSFAFITTSMALLTFGIENPVSANEISNTTTPNELATSKASDSTDNSNSESISENNNDSDSNNVNKNQTTTPNELATSKASDSTDNSNSENIAENNNDDYQQLFNSLTNFSASYTQDFIDQVTPGAIAGWKNYGILPSISIAQAIIESGWGRSTLATQGNNLFGIKGSYNGQSIYLPTQEYINGQWVTVNAAFRKYPNWSASIEDHGAFLHDNSRYNNLIGVKDYVTVANDLHIDGYATAPNYAQSLINCVDSYDLTKIDQEAFSGGSTPTPSTPTVTPASGTYTFNQTTNIRNAPSLDSQVIGQYEAGESVTYNGIVQADGYTWLRYTSYSGEYHYVAELGGSTPTPTPSTPTVTPASGTYTFNQTTNIRTAPNLSSQVIGQYEAGESVTYNGIVQADGYTWLRYTSYSGEYRYVAEL